MRKADISALIAQQELYHYRPKVPALSVSKWQQTLFCNFALHKSALLRCGIVLRAYYACMYEKSRLYSLRPAESWRFTILFHTLCLHFPLRFPDGLEHDRVTVHWVPETHVYLVAATATRVSVRLTTNGSCMTPSWNFYGDHYSAAGTPYAPFTWPSMFQSYSILFPA